MPLVKIEGRLWIQLQSGLNRHSWFYSTFLVFAAGCAINSNNFIFSSSYVLQEAVYCTIVVLGGPSPSIKAEEFDVECLLFVTGAGSKWAFCTITSACQCRANCLSSPILSQHISAGRENFQRQSRAAVRGIWLGQGAGLCVAQHPLPSGCSGSGVSGLACKDCVFHHILRAAVHSSGPGS